MTTLQNPSENAAPTLKCYGTTVRMGVFKPPRLGGGMFANILLGGDVCQLLAKIQPKAGKRPFVCKIQYFVSKMHKQMMFASFYGRKMLANILF